VAAGARGFTCGRPGGIVDAKGPGARWEAPMDKPERDDMRAADYVLGLMEPNETAFFERDMRNDPALARHVADWRERFDEAATPQAGMRRRIEAGLYGFAAVRSGGWPVPGRLAVRIAAALAGIAVAAALLGLLPV
jgi:anti-sigma-K factor RskA